MNSLLSPIKSEAHDTYFLQVLIDEGSRQYQGNVVEDGSGSESKHIENSLGDFQEIFNKESALYPKVSDNADDYEKTEIGEDIAVFSFTPEEQGEAAGGKKKNNATKDDIDRAYAIRDTLLPGLNDALFILNGKKQFKTTKEMMAMAEKLTGVGVDAGATVIEGKDSNGKKMNYTITYKKRGYPKEKLTDYRRQTLGITQSDFVKIEGGEEVYEFVYRMPKGYSHKTKNGDVTWDNRVYNSDYDYKGDAKYITWHMLVYQANYALFENGWTMTKAQDIDETNMLEDIIIGLLQSTLNGLRNLLGLYSLNELIYNDGIRGSSAWVHGAMPETWHDNVVKYHMVFQAFAWALISLAVVKSLIQRNLSTINPAMRVSLIEQIQNLLLTGFILSAIFPIIAMFMYLNVKVVDVFGSLSPDFGDFAGLNNYSNWLAGMILQIFYFVVTLYLNFVYIMRSITLAILIAMAPLFVVTIAFGGHWKQLFGTWMKELLANIFLQSFHAFILAFFVTTTVSSRGIESMVLAFAMIPLTEFFRSMVMGQAGGIGHQLGVGATTAAMGAGMKAIGMAGKGAKGVAGKFSGQGKDDAESQAIDMMNNKSSNSQDMGKGQQQPIKSVKGGNLDQVRANQNKETPLGVYSKGSNADKEHYEKGKSKEMSGFKAGVMDAGKAFKPSSAGALVSGAGSAISGIAQAGVGAGMMLALGGSSGIAMAQASHMVDDGIDKVKDSTVRPVAGAIGSAYNSVKEGIQMDMKPKFKSPVDNSGVTSNNLGYQPTANGQGVHVHRSQKDMHENGGIVSATMNGNNAVYKYDESRLGSGDLANLQHYEKVFSSGNAEDIAHLKANGVENVNRIGDSGYAVTYNRVGMEQMGIESVNTIGSGSNQRIVEAKRNDQPLSTYNTVNVQSAPPRQSPILDSSGNNIQVASQPTPNSQQSRPTPHPVQSPLTQPQNPQTNPNQSSRIILP